MIAPTVDEKEKRLKTAPEKAYEKWKKGIQSPNPGGRKKGTFNYFKRWQQANSELLYKSAGDIVEYAISRALNGNDNVLLKLLDKILVTPKQLDVTVNKSVDIRDDIRQHFEKVITQRITASQEIAAEIIEVSIEEEGEE